MPSGRYTLHDPHDRSPLGEERFRCAPGPTGWRYVAHRTAPDGATTGRLDLALDDLGRPIRLEAVAGDWQLRGAALDGVRWVRTDPTGQHAREGHAAAKAFTGTSPAFLVALARLLRPAPGRATRVRLLALTDPVLAPRTVDRSWSLVASEDHHDPDAGTLTVHSYGIDDLATGDRSVVHLSGDVVLDAPGVTLEELDGPPSVFDTLPLPATPE
ncbi:hypothetical protein [Streptomyces spiramenti]|uniref:Uncharacterized protein n=1 Tax=Streptomyces spiramenti TaxID=2720606 RepID=A0ABX1AXD1_9ACTN|nr:hypothetical protein [Streptomyces spiramenti]NJP68892.1 hypothetical protein [Streptomyces spiramenti]